MPMLRDPMSNNYNLTQFLSFPQRQIALVVNKLQGADIGSHVIHVFCIPDSAKPSAVV